MMTIYLSSDQELVVVDKITSGCWINMLDPTADEIQFVMDALHIEADLLKAALDEEERSHIETDEETNHALILVDIPFAEFEGQSRAYNTYPLGIILTEECIVTVCIKETQILKTFMNNSVRTFLTQKKSRFILQILYKNAEMYLRYLKQIDKQSSVIETELHKSLKNKELIQLLELEKSLVYFSTSLKSNELVMERLRRFDFINKYADDKELLEDTIIENKQAIEMAKIYSDILSGTMDAFASVISNNLNIVMKFLASITIIMSIPTVISSFWGMNVLVPGENHPYAFVILVLFAIVTCICAAVYMAKKKMF